MGYVHSFESSRKVRHGPMPRPLAVSLTDWAIAATYVSKLATTSGVMSTTCAMIMIVTVNSSFFFPNGPTPEKSIYITSPHTTGGMPMSVRKSTTSA